MPKRILVVEDERDMSLLLEQALAETGYSVTVASNGKEGLAKAQDHDLLIVDVMMPFMNGYEMVRQLREAGSRVPVLFLTAKDTVADRVKGLNLGADDYLVKPFKLEELLARIQAILRRTARDQDVLEAGDIWMDVRTRKARRGQHWLSLSQTEMAVLEVFLERPGQIVTKDLLIQAVWHEETPRDPNIAQVYVNFLRTKLEAKGMSRVIHTVHNKGYFLNVDDDQP